MRDRSSDPPARSKTAPTGAASVVATRRVSAVDWATSEHLQSLVDNTTTPIYVKDAAGRYLLINRQYESIFHVNREDFLGRTDADFFPRDVAHALRENDLEVMRRDEPVEFVESVPHDDGDVHTYISVKFPLRDEHGRPEGICGISTDITLRQAAELQLRRLAQQLVTIREEERQRLSFRIHDEICQELTGVTFMLAAARRRLSPEAAEPSAELERASTQLMHVIDHLRSVARGLHPVLLRDLGLAESLRSLAQTLSTPRVTIELDVADQLPELGAELALAVYRITQESVLNAVRHADAKRIRVTVTVDRGALHLLIADDGRGFDARATTPRGLGLLGMEQRAIAVGGALRVDSEPERGTRVAFDCPPASRAPTA
jgi:PAS domain S-box-containing protein